MMTDQPAHRPEDAAEGPDPAGGPAPSEQAKIAELVETLARESADNKDKLLRALAEMENLRRRTERQVADARDYAITAFARDVLAVSDNMHRAMEATGPELKDTLDGSVKALLDGVELTERELLKVLEKHGVRKFEPKGERFDPNIHQAMFELPDPSVPAGTVAQVVQAGYMLGDRVLRPALVAVAKGGPRMAPPAEAKAAEPPANDNAGASPQEPQNYD